MIINRRVELFGFAATTIHLNLVIIGRLSYFLFSLIGVLNLVVKIILIWFEIAALPWNN